MVPTPFDQKAFALAYALSFPSREIAIAILKSARIRAVEIRREQEHRRIALRSWRRYHSLRRLLDPYRPDFAAATCLQVAICEVTTAWEQCQEQGGLLWGEELKNPARLATRLQTARDPLSQYLHAHIAAMPQQSLVDSLNGLLRQAHVWQPQRWARVSLTPQLLALTNQNLLGAALIRRNRLLLEAAYPGEIVPHWGPTLEDLLVRYVKYLSWYAMIRGSRHVAVGLGCLLYRYAPSKMVRLFPMTVSSPGRLKKRLTEALKTRFPDLNPESARQPHDANERTRVLRWLWMLAPWSPSCHSHPASRPTALFDTNAPAWECARIHALCCEKAVGGCAGFPAIVADYNTNFREARHMLEPPDDKLELPEFPAPCDGPEARFAPAPLTPEEFTAIEDDVQHQQQRRAQYHPGLLHVYVEGEKVAEFDPRTSACLRLRVPRGASNVEIYGRDAEGPLLLAVFPVAGLGDYEVGRTVHFLLSAVRGEGGELSEPIVELTYLVSSLATARALWEQITQPVRELGGRLRRAFGWLAVVVPGVPALLEAPLAVVRALGQLCTHRVSQLPRALRWAETTVTPVRTLAEHGVHLVVQGWRLPVVRYACVALLSAAVGGVGVYGYYSRYIQGLQAQVAQAQLFQDIAASKLLPDVPARKRSETQQYVQELVTRLQQGMYGATFKTATTVATMFLYAEDFDAALEWFAKAQALDPDEPEPYKAMAAIAKIKGDHRQSIHYLEQLFARQKDRGIRDPQTPNYLGWAYYALGQEPEAIVSYDQALAWSPNYADALFNRALVYQRQGHEAQYRALLEQARRLLQQDIMAHPKHARAYFGLAKLSAHEANWPQAKQQLLTAIALDPEWAFWVQYEPFYPAISTTVAGMTGTIRDVADMYIADKIAQMRALLPRTG